MDHTKRTILVTMLFFAVAATICPAKAADKARVLHFPKDRSIGMLKIQGADTVRRIEDFYHSIGKTDWWNSDWEYLGEAMGDVTIPKGKRLALFVSKAAWRDLSPLSKLDPNDLYMLRLPGSMSESIKPDDRCMQHIAGLTGLKVLVLHWTNIGSKGLQHLKNFKKLERLYLPDRTTNKGLSYIAELPSLKGLYFKGNRVTNVGLKYLAKLSSLEELELGGSQHISDAGLIHLANLPKLRYLLLFGDKFTNQGLTYLKDIPNLRTLLIGTITQMTDDGMAHVANLSKLERLGFNPMSQQGITDAGLTHLKKRRSLKKLDLSNAHITDAGLAHLSEIKSLEHLDLPWGFVNEKGSMTYTITDKGLPYIGQLTKLKHLKFGATGEGGPISDTGLSYLTQLHSLEELTISGKNITDAGMSHISKLTNLKDLSLFGCPQVTNEGLTKLTALKSLRKLNLYETKVTISGLSQLNVLSELVLLDAKSIEQDNSVLNISGLTKLECLTINLNFYRKDGDLAHDPIRDEDLACLKKLKNLKFLHISQTKYSMITDTGIAPLRDLINMANLAIGSPYLTDKSLSCLANMKTLNYLTISGNFTDEGLGYLEELKALQHLKIYSANNFSPAALKQLKDNLPNLSSFTADQDRDLKRMSKNNPEPPMNSSIAPSFVIKTLEGKDIKFEDYRGKVVMLYFWATWCRPCVAGTPKLKKLYVDMKASFGEDFEMISLSMDDNEHLVREHIKKYDLAWPQVRIGLHSKISSDYGVNDTAPRYFLIGPEGKILLTPDSPQVDTKSFIEKTLKNRKT
ncbi:redoxin domain-containing protein [Planctomycetota bacterium]